MKEHKYMPLDDPLSTLFMDHKTLGNLLPFNCGWLDDGTGKPDIASVSIGPLIFSVDVWNKPRKVWKN